MKLPDRQFLVAALAFYAAFGPWTANAEVVTFNMKDVAKFSSTTPDSVVVTTAQIIPGGINNSAAGNEFNLSSLQFDIDGDLDPLAADPTIFYDFQVRTALFSGGQIVFDGFHHVFPPAQQNGSYVVTKNENSYLNFPFLDGDLIGDGVDEFVRNGFGPPGPPNNNTFNVALDAGGTVRYFAEGVDNFVGFKLATGSYGWIRVLFDSTAGEGTGSLTFLDGAYETTGGPIAAGQTVSGIEDADFDGSGRIDGADFLAWQRGFGKAGDAVLADGDANSDFSVTNADFFIWRDQFGSPAVVASAGSIPEPRAACLSAGFIALILRVRRRVAHLS